MRRVRVLRLPVVGAAAGGVGILVLGYMANRYLSDLIPLLVLTATARRRGGGRGGRPVAAGRSGVAVLGGLAVLALWGAWVNTSLGLQYQREIAPGAPGDSRVSWLEWQARLGPTRGSPGWRPGDPLPPSDRVGRVVVIGELRRRVPQHRRRLAAARGRPGDAVASTSTSPRPAPPRGS